MSDEENGEHGIAEFSNQGKQLGSESELQKSCKKVRDRDISLQSQSQAGRDRMVPGACWPSSLVYFNRF